MDSSSLELGVKAGRNFIEAKDDEWPIYFGHLRRNKELLAVTRQLNQLLNDPEHRQLAINAFKRIGLWNDFAAPRRQLRIAQGGPLRTGNE